MSSLPPYSYTGSDDIKSAPENQMNSELYARVAALEARLNAAAGGSSGAISGLVTYDTYPKITANPATLDPQNVITKQELDFYAEVGQCVLQFHPKTTTSYRGMEWALVYGQTFLKSAYPDLFAKWGYAFDTSLAAAGTNFRAPDPRSCALAVLNNLGGADSGRINVQGTWAGNSVVGNLANQAGARFGAQTLNLENKNMPTGTMLRYDPDVIGRQTYALGAPGTGVNIGESNNNTAISLLQPTMGLYIYARVK